MTNDWPNDEVVRFSALGLLQPTASAMWSLPFEVNDMVEELAPETGMNNADWRQHIVIPLYRDVIVPALPLPVEATYAETGQSRSPIAVHRIGTEPVPVRTEAAVKVAGRLDKDKHRVALPAVFLAEVLLGTASLRVLAGVPLHLISLAFEAGLAPTEIRDRHAAGTLDVQSLSLMAGLRA